MTGHVSGDDARAAILDELVEAVLDHDVARAVELARSGVAGAVPIARIVADGLGAGLRVAVEQYARRERYLVELFNASRTVDEALEALAPELGAAEATLPRHGTVVVGVIAPNVPDLGKRLLAIILRAHGFDVVDLGANVAPERFAAAAEHGAPVIAVTVMTNDGVPQLARLVQSIRSGPGPHEVLVLCGGAAASPAIAASLGIRYGRDAGEAVEIIREHRTRRRPRTGQPASPPA